MTRQLAAVLLCPALLPPGVALAGQEQAKDAQAEVEWAEAPIDPAGVAREVEHDKHAGVMMVVAGSIGIALGGTLMMAEYAVRPSPGQVRVWSLEGCMLSFITGSVIVPLGAHLVSAGIGALLRSRQLSRLHTSMTALGPGEIWEDWAHEGRGFHKTGHVFAAMGSALIATGLMASIPFTCERWQCRAWPEYGGPGYEARWAGKMSIALLTVGAFMSTVGIATLSVGYARQSRSLGEISPQDGRQVSVILSPGGLILRW